jgi:hypothetical protein
MFAPAFGQSNLDGTYIGLDPICWALKNGRIECYSDPATPERKWYHLTYLKIKGNSVFADQDPVNIYKRDTVYSSSDGAFYYYRGTIDRTGSSATIKMQLIYCDYCAVPAKNSPNAYLFPASKNYVCTLSAKGISINGYLFKKTADKEMISEKHRRK